MTAESAALSRVICDIYDAAIDTERWDNTLESVCRFIGGHEARLYWHGPGGSASTLHTYNCDQHYTRLYEESYAALNPFFPAFFFIEAGVVAAGSDLVPYLEMRQTRFHEEWLVPQGLTDTLGFVVEKEVTRGSFMTVQWRGSEIDSDSRRRMELLVPHIQRAVSIGRLFTKHAASERALMDTLDHVDTGVFLIAANGRIVFANASGQRMVRDGDLVWSSQDELRAASKDANRILVDGLRAAAETDDESPAQGLTITLSETPGQSWTATILPLHDGARRKVGDAHRAVAAVFVRNATFADPTPLETVAKIYQLTAGEIRVVDTLLRISGIDAIAVALGVSRATVKTHLNHIFRKTGARNQGELIKLIAGLGSAG